jgi:hypothetical protein
MHGNQAELDVEFDQTMRKFHDQTSKVKSMGILLVLP